MSTLKGGHWCAATNCKSNSKQHKAWSFFRFPKNEERCKIWIQNCGRDDLLNRTAEYCYKNCFLCGLHFDDIMFLNDLRNRLKGNAIPREIVNFPVRAPSTSRYICAVSGCNSKSNKNLGFFFHTFPKFGKSVVQIENTSGILETVDRLVAWKQVLKLTTVTPRMTVCSLHFNENDYVLSNYKLQRKKLKRNSVPSRNLPSDTIAIKTEANDARLQPNIISTEKEFVIKVEAKDDDTMESTVPMETNCFQNDDSLIKLEPEVVYVKEENIDNDFSQDPSSSTYFLPKLEENMDVSCTISEKNSVYHR